MPYVFAPIMSPTGTPLNNSRTTNAVLFQCGKSMQRFCNPHAGSQVVHCQCYIEASIYSSRRRASIIAAFQNQWPFEYAACPLTDWVHELWQYTVQYSFIDFIDEIFINTSRNTFQRKVIYRTLRPEQASHKNHTCSLTYLDIAMRSYQELWDQSKSEIH